MEPANWKRQKVQLRRGAAAEWSAKNALLLLGEPGYETDTRRVKIGDGLTRWNGLPYWSPGAAGASVPAGDYGQVVVNSDGTWSVDISPADIGASATGHSHSASDISSGTLPDGRLSANVVLTSDARLTDAREWSAATVTQAEAEAGTSTSRRAFTPQRVFQAIAAWWTASAFKAKLDGIASGATANSTDAQLRDRSTHTGSQAISTVSGLQAALDGKAESAHTHSGSDITSGTVAYARLPVGSTAFTVCAGDDARLSESRPPSSHTHGNITNAGAIGSTENLPLITTTSGVITVGAFGTTANTFCQGNDSRLSDARTPLSHTHDDRYYTEGEVDSLLASKQAAGTYATLVNGTVPSGQLPGYVDDILEYSTQAGFPETGESGKLYVSTSVNKVFRWSGTTYIEIVGSPGSTDAVAEGTTNLYFTTVRAAAAAPVQSVAGRSGTVTLSKSDVGLGNVDNTSDASKPISTATQTALDAKAASSHTHDDRYYTESESDTLLAAKASLSGATFTGVIAASTATDVPVYTFSGDTNCGILHPASDTLAIVTFGAERMRFTDAGKILVGATASRTAGPSVHPVFQFEGTTAGSVSYQCICGSTTATVSPQILLARHRGAVGGSDLVLNGDSLGVIRFNGGDGTDCISTAAQIECKVDGEPGSNDMPGALLLSTASDGASAATERVRITAAGLVGIGTASPANTLHVNGTIRATSLTDGTTTRTITQVLAGGTPSRTVQSVTSSTQTLSITDSYAGVLSCALTSNVTLTLPSPANGSAFTLILRQDATGGRVATFANTLWPSGSAPAMRTGANEFNVVQFFSDGVSWYGVPVNEPPPANVMWSIE